MHLFDFYYLSARRTVLALFFASIFFAVSAEAQTTLAFSVKVGNPATAYPAYPYTSISEYFSTISTIAVTCSNGAADIRYTTDGTAPTLSSASIANNGTLVLSKKFTLWAKAFLGGTEVASTQENYHATGMIAAGADHALALPSTGGVVFGSVWAWGENAARQVGFGSSTTDQPVKIAVQNSLGAYLSGVKALAGGSNFSLALLNDGTIQAWGGGTASNQGQLGNNSSLQTGVSAEHYIVGVRDGTGAAGTHLSGVVGIAAGALHSLAITTDGSATGKVWAWGNNASYQIGDNAASAVDRLYPVPVLKAGSLTSLDDVVQVSAGVSHSVALTSSGYVYGWGLNSSGQVLGSTLTTSPIKTATPASVFQSPYETATNIACGDNFTLVVRAADHTVWGWGANTYGQLGNNSTATAQRTAVIVVNSLTGYQLDNVIMVAAGTSHALGLRSDGTVWAWGDNTLGKLGDGTITDRHTAVPITIPGYVIAIAAGGDFSMALTEDGKIYTWGNPASGRLGDGTINNTAGVHYSPATSSSYSPILLNRPPTTSLSSYSLSNIQPGSLTLHPMAVDADKNLVRWDFYDGGTFLGTLTAAGDYAVSGLAAGVHSFTCKVFDSAGESASATVSATIVAPTVTVSAPIASTSEALPSSPGTFRFTVSPVQIWPITVNYTLGGTATNGSDYSTLSGTAVIPANTSSVDVNVIPLVDHATEGVETVIMALSTNAGYIIGSGSQATVTIADNPPVVAPVIYPDPSAKTRVGLVQVSCPTPGATICYTTDGSDPGPTSHPSTVTVYLKVTNGMTLKAKAFKSGMPDSDQVGGTYSGKAYAAAGYDSSFALLSNGSAWAWGSNANGRLGLGSATATFNQPQPLPALSNARSISSSATYTAAVLSDGTFAAFGSFPPSFGDATTTSSNTPVSVSGLTGAKAATAGKNHLAVLMSDGTVWAWGTNSHGQLGNGTSSATSTKTPVQMLKSAGVPFDHVVDLAAGDDFTVLLTDDGNAWVCGYSIRLGTSATADAVYPAQVTSLSNVAAVSSGWTGVRAVKMDGTAVLWGETASDTPVNVYSLTGSLSIKSGYYCSALLSGSGVVSTYGQNPYGERGDGSYTGIGGATPIGMPLLVTQADLRFHHCLAFQDDGREAVLWAWGANYSGQLGIGTTNTSQSVPWPVNLTYPQATGDTNGDGLSDWDDFRLGLSSSDLDLDHDGISNANELLLGTSPFSADTDGDGHPDNADAFPLDPTRWQAPTVDPNDHTPPIITLSRPSGITLQ